MKAVYSFFKQNRIRLSFLLSLIFFGLFLPACRQNSKEEIAISWKNKQAIGISIPRSFLKETDSISRLLKIRLEKNAGAMLGEYIEERDYIMFRPLVPLSPGLSYEIFFNEAFLGKIKVPALHADEPTKLIAIYPSPDTLPENLLKMYFRFSGPMREGEALKYISLTDSKGDTLAGTFLDLQPELWNKERTVLTLWLDPGRIKRELIPNQEMGNPLKKGNRYSVNISNRWKNAYNFALPENYTKQFIVVSRDSLLPQPQLWKIDTPPAGTLQPLVISTNEPLDYFLPGETIEVLNEKGIAIAGNLTIKNKETSIQFLPNSPWRSGRYTLRVATYLEDLAGNNLHRPFDRDMRITTKIKDPDFIDRKFFID